MPPHVAWDLFLGPAPERPYNGVYHPHDWRGWWDFGTGALGDMACHTANLPFLSLKLKYPTSVQAEAHPGAKTYRDFRKLLEEQAPKIDAVVVSTPDHTHAPAAVMAMRLGKAVYCQKPLAHSAYEARLMRETAAERKVATQMGNQGTANPGFREGIELIRSGTVGPIREVHVWTNRPFKYW